MGNPQLVVLSLGMLLNHSGFTPTVVDTELAPAPALEDFVAPERPPKVDGGLRLLQVVLAKCQRFAPFEMMVVDGEYVWINIVGYCLLAIILVSEFLLIMVQPDTNGE